MVLGVGEVSVFILFFLANASGVLRFFQAIVNNQHRHIGSALSPNADFVLPYPGFA